MLYLGVVRDEELPYYYGACRLYVCSALSEGFNLPAVEAQACGKRVVAFRHTAHVETIKNGVLVEGQTARALADAIIGEISPKNRKKIKKTKTA